MKDSLAQMEDMKKKKSRSGRHFFDDLRIATCRYREINKITQEEFAERVGNGVTGPVISNFETGKNLPGEDVLNGIIHLVRAPSAVWADEMRNIAEMLESPGFSEAIKSQRFSRRIAEILIELEAINAAADKGSQRHE